MFFQIPKECLSILITNQQLIKDLLKEEECENKMKYNQNFWQNQKKKRKCQDKTESVIKWNTLKIKK